MAFKRIAKALGVFTLLCGGIFAQSTTGTLLGSVSDPGDAAIPGAHVELINSATGAVVSTTTGAEGLFRFNRK